MATVGSANLNIVAKFDNLGKSVQEALAKIDTSSAGGEGGSSYGTSFTTSMASVLGGGAVAGIMASITSEVTSVLSDAMNAAIQRSDIMANYPIIMQNLGYTSDEAESSISKMSTQLEGLPTSISDMTSTVQGIAAITGDLDLATDAGIALNDMLLAGGNSTQLTSAAMEQFRQILAKGTPNLQDWNSLTTAMPGQMNQLAEEMLGAGATADDLYTALGGGGADATISTTDLLNAMIKLDQDGGDNMVSFKNQALDATGGIETSMDNMETAVVRGLAGIIDSIGRENITGAISGIGDAFEGAMDVVSGAIDAVRPLIDGLMGAIGAIEPYAGPAIMALGGFATLSVGVSSGVEALSKAVDNTSNIFGPASTMAGKLSDAFLDMAASCDEGSTSQERFLDLAGLFSGASGAGLVAGIGVVVGTVAATVAIFYDAYEKAEAYKTATEGLVGVVEDAVAPVSAIEGAYDSVMGSSETTLKSVADVRQALEDSVNATGEIVSNIADRTADMQTSIGLLETYQDTIDDYMNHAGLNAVQQEELKIAVDRVNEACGTQYEVVDAANGKIADETGTIMDNTDALDDNIEQTIRRLKVEALEEDYKDIYKQQYEDLKLLNDAQAEWDKVSDEYIQAQKDYEEYGLAISDDLQRRYDEAAKNLDIAKDKVNSNQTALNELGQAMYDTEAGTEPFTIAFETMGDDVQGAFQDMGISVDDFAQLMVDSGVHADKMSAMTSEDFNKMYEQCGGDMDKLMQKLRDYNNITIEPKNAPVDTSEPDKANAAREEWNANTWFAKRANVEVSQSGIIGGPLGGNAEGGIRLNAEGGIQTYAGIATSAVPLDVVGEDGAEAIVPLTNRRYSLPFAQLIAEEVGNLNGLGETVINNTYYVGDIKLAGADAEQFGEYLQKYVTMGRY